MKNIEKKILETLYNHKGAGTVDGDNLVVMWYEFAQILRETNLSQNDAKSSIENLSKKGYVKIDKEWEKIKITENGISYYQENILPPKMGFNLPPTN